jgi:hypothetical protein
MQLEMRLALTRPSPPGEGGPIGRAGMAHGPLIIERLETFVDLKLANHQSTELGTRVRLQSILPTEMRNAGILNESLVPALCRSP